MPVKEHNYTLSVTAGPSYNPSTHKPVAVNSPIPHLIETEHATIDLRVRIQDYTGLPPNSPRTSPYFSHPTRTKDQYSIAVSFVPKHAIPGSELVFGNDFDRPIRDRLPPGTNQALRIVQWTIDPGLEGDAYADKPYLYGAALSSWNYLRVCGVAKERKGGDAVVGGEGEGKGIGNSEEEIIEEGGEGSGQEMRRKLGVPDDPAGRRKFFLTEGNRERFEFEEGRLYKADFGNGYLGFNDFSLRLPGFKIKVTKYIDAKNHQLRYVLKNKRTGDVYFVVLFTLLLGRGSVEDDWDDENANDADDVDEDNGENTEGSDDRRYYDDDEGVD
ncbi:hypothetical protein RJZ56_005449 [Blastomyces dermatitidis]|uniref:Domain of unknown function at the cortex 1 domain-containing protein n=3 Tax=Blastomyces TaxID=229219 RepID=A0A179V1U3_BLAGS|nr:uncharacterized protein BDBG_09366 [Blastomyces gilchristii SLH14081]XP_045273223.1 uncharacterized protein BDCG_08747 [Blastomyces dermatitidis ER-3]EGE82374.1 hypothetical protein BDDG_05318 [Blastomyces dermatitidis ATCC 18188]EQL34978.1 hypothetical protein BDFG_03198 [Blastomyces dermatitidis ATCC 26199]EEQ85478.1 hypothetical protein BDCG_08747 [Blastomyces dermatitidis ER-3]OAT14304.1 hypothetical protein BDBG_09366 [Blastomyces gilchristii SLH14081]